MFTKGVTYKDRGGSAATILEVVPETHMAPSHLLVHSHYDANVTTFGLDGRYFWRKEEEDTFLEDSIYDLLPSEPDIKPDTL